MKRTLIVNADDCNLTSGVTQAILDCHDRGIVSSTTFLVNLPIHSKTIEALKQRTSLGVGLHLNVTLGKPVLASNKVRSLIKEEGFFFKERAMAFKSQEIFNEYEAQAELFKKIFGKLPTHFDTHHQLHDELLFFDVLSAIADKYQLPIRRSKVMAKTLAIYKSPDHFFGDLRPEGYWRPEVLDKVLEALPEGVSEVMCHPGYIDDDLTRISSFLEGRAQEAQLFGGSELKAKLAQLGIELSHYGICYT